jgi:hypothetical protein
LLDDTVQIYGDGGDGLAGDVGKGHVEKDVFDARSVRSDIQNRFPMLIEFARSAARLAFVCKPECSSSSA